MQYTQGNKLTQEQLAEILAKHSAWLRGEAGGERANLSKANLSWVDLYGADLSRADLGEANLSRANLSGADLSWANLSKADLSKADLSGANLYVNASDGVTGLALYTMCLSRHRLVYRGDTDEIQIGCQKHTREYWLEHGRRIGAEADYTEEQIEDYMLALQLVNRMARKEIRHGNDK